MDYQHVATKVLSFVGDSGNIDHAITCLTRLRIAVHNMDLVEFEELRRQEGVLGVVARNHNEIEVVFGPHSIEGISQAFSNAANINLEPPEYSSPESLQALKDEEIDGGEDAPSIVDLGLNTKSYIISAGKKQSYRAQQQAAIDGGRLPEEDIDALKDFLSESDSTPKNKSVKTGKAVLVLNGPNLNMLGIREPSLYGREDYNTLVRICKASASDAGFTDIRCFQSNHEGALVDEIQNALGLYDGIVINPGAYTHTSVAILDAVKAVNLPCVEVHISKVEEREDFRQVSYIRAACFETITGLGIEGYRKAIFDLAEHLGMNN